MRELYLDPSLYEFVDTLDIESYERFCAVTDACASALQRMTKKPDACTVRAFGVTVRVERSKDRKYYVICAIDIVDLDPPPEGWGKNPAAILETYFELPPCISDRVIPTRNPAVTDSELRFIGSRIEQKRMASLFNVPSAAISSWISLEIFGEAPATPAAHVIELSASGAHQISKPPRSASPGLSNVD